MCCNISNRNGERRCEWDDGECNEATKKKYGEKEITSESIDPTDKWNYSRANWHSNTIEHCFHNAIR